MATCLAPGSAPRHAARNNVQDAAARRAQTARTMRPTYVHGNHPRETQADGVFCYTFFKGVGEKPSA